MKERAGRKKRREAEREREREREKPFELSVSRV